MKAASVNELKKELESRKQTDLLSFCLRLAKFKKENKELLTFLLFEAGDLTTYTENVKHELTALFAAINSSNIYYIKKSVRKILRSANKWIRFSASKPAGSNDRDCYTFETFAAPSRDIRTAYYRYHQRKRIGSKEETRWS